MLAQSLFRSNKISLPLILASFILICSTKVWSYDLRDQTAIIASYLAASSEDRAIADSMTRQARERAAVNNRSNLGPLVKLWCDSAAFAPNPENLVECARFRFKAASEMSNPKLSEEAARIQHAQESLIMIRAALEIAGGDPNVSDALRQRLKSDANCFRAIIANAHGSKECD